MRAFALAVVLLLHTYVLLADERKPAGYDSLELLVKRNPRVVVPLLEQLKSQYPREHNYSYLMAKAYINLGKHRIADSLIEGFLREQALRKDSVMYIHMLELEATNNRILDQFDKALATLSVVEDYYNRHRDRIGLLHVTLLFAECYRASSQYNQALQSLDRAAEIGNNLPGGMPLRSRMRLYNRKAAVFLEMAIHLDSVEWLSKEVMRMAREIHDNDQLASSANELGFLYLNQNKPEAEKYLLLAISIWAPMGYKIYENNARINLSRYYLKSGQPRRAIRIAEESLKTVHENGWLWDDQTWNEIISTAYLNMGDYKKAFYYSEIAKKQMILNHENQFNERIAYYADKLDLKEKEEEIVKKNQEVTTARQEVIIHRQEKQTLMIMLASLVVILVGIIIAYFQINRQRRLLGKQKSEIDNINKELEALLSQKEILLREVNHRVKNNLSLLSGMMYLKQGNLKSAESVNVMRDMQGRINSISLIHESMIQAANPEMIDFQHYLEYLSHQIARAYNLPEGKSIRFHIDFEQFKPELAKAVSVAMILNELITNSVKYAFKAVEQPAITMHYEAENRSIVYFDNGPGYIPGSGEKSLGMRLVEILSQQIKAKLMFEKSNGFTCTRIQFD